MSGTPGEVSLSSVWARLLNRPARLKGPRKERKSVRKGLLSTLPSNDSTKSDTAASYSLSGLIHEVYALASFTALSM